MTAPRKSIAAFCLFLFAFYGCAAVPQMKERTDFLSPEAALKHLAAQIPDEVALQALANIQMTTREGRYPLKLAIVLKKPASLRVEAIPLFGPPVFFLSIRDQTLKVFLSGNRAFYIGRATLDNIARYVPLRMDPEEMIAVLMGTGPPLCEQNTFLQGRPEGEHYRIDIKEALKRQSLWLRMTDGFLEHLEVIKDQGSSYRARFEEPLRIEGSVIPQKTTIVFEGEDGAVVSIRFADIQFLRQSDPAIFDLKAPPGITPVYLD
jgi:hypothetical protein